MTATDRRQLPESAEGYVTESRLANRVRCLAECVQKALGVLSSKCASPHMNQGRTFLLSAAKYMIPCGSPGSSAIRGRNGICPLFNPGKMVRFQRPLRRTERFSDLILRGSLRAQPGKGLGENLAFAVVRWLQKKIERLMTLCDRNICDRL
jgi:hypothetical protein